MSRNRKILVGVILVAVLATGAKLSVSQRGERGIDVRFDTVSRRDLVETVTASGNIRAGRVVDISSDVSARVASLYIHEGDDVVAGQTLLRLDPTRFEAQVSRARASLNQARANAAQQKANNIRMEREFQRLSVLFQRDSLLVKRQLFEDAQTNLEVAGHQLDGATYGVAQAEAALDEAEEQLSKTIFVAPISGKITRLNVEEGETVIVGTMNNPGSLVLTISELETVEAVVQVDETDIPYLSLGDSAVLELDAFPNQLFAGVVTEIGNSAIRPPSSMAAAGQTAAIDFEVVIVMGNPPGGVRPDLSATADIITSISKDALAIPIISLTVRQSDDEDAPARDPNLQEREAGPATKRPEDRDVEGVLLVRDGVVTFTPVEVGITGQEYFEIVSGVKEGDTLVAGPYQRIRELKTGDAVRDKSSRGSDDGN